MKRRRFRLLAHAALPALVAELVSASGVGALTLDRFILPLPDARIEIGAPAAPGDRGTRSVVLLARSTVVSPPGEWQAAAVAEDEFIVRHRDWRGVRLDVDCSSGSVFRVPGDEMTVPDPSTRLPLWPRPTLPRTLSFRGSAPFPWFSGEDWRTSGADSSHGPDEPRSTFEGRTPASRPRRSPGGWPRASPQPKPVSGRSRPPSMP